MGIPLVTNVAGVEYQAEYVEGLSTKYNLYGQVTYSDAKIEIDPDLCEERKEQVYVHELLHAVFYEAGYEAQDEEMINRVGKVLYQVLKDNEIKF